MGPEALPVPGSTPRFEIMASEAPSHAEVTHTVRKTTSATAIPSSTEAEARSIVRLNKGPGP